MDKSRVYWPFVSSVFFLHFSLSLSLFSMKADILLLWPRFHHESWWSLSFGSFIACPSHESLSLLFSFPDSLVLLHMYFRAIPSVIPSCLSSSFDSLPCKKGLHHRDQRIIISNIKKNINSFSSLVSRKITSLSVSLTGIFLSTQSLS
jgi:hypothetical protein